MPRDANDNIARETTSQGSAPARTCIVGAGSIAAVHAEVLSERADVDLVCVVDPAPARARALAERWGVDRVFGSVDDALAAGELDRVHICVPPDLHAAVAAPFVAAGLPTLVEKPMAASGEEARGLARAAYASGAAVGVNHNFTHHPAFTRLAARVARGEIGRMVSVECVFNLPLRQISAGQFAHWMFSKPVNLLLEQAVHPLSQISALAGPIRRVAGLGGAAREVAPGLPLYTECDVSLDCERASAHLRFAVGQTFPVWLLTAVGEDGAIVCDMIGNREASLDRGRWLEPVDHLLAGLRFGGAWMLASGRNATNYVGSLTWAKRRSDPFYLSMKGSIGAFHDRIGRGDRPDVDAEAGAGLVEVCEDIAARLGWEAPAPRNTPARSARPRNAGGVVVFGGTGFIGKAVVAKLLAADRSVTVVARNIRNLPAVFDDERVTLVRADTGSVADVRAAVDGAVAVVNLAHGGGGSGRVEIERAMVGGARVVADACAEASVARLVHVGSIASLYLGDATEVIDNATPPDAIPELRADYARAKAMTDEMLLSRNKGRGTAVCIVRPGLVVGPGTSPFHSGFGFYNNEQHCLGWNAGTNPLPLVLVTDVADAIVRAVGSEWASGTCFNLVGDVRPTARQCIAEIARQLRRPLRYHPQNTYLLYLAERGKWLIKRAAGRRDPGSSLRELRSRGLVAQFDCADTKAALGWHPVMDRDVFMRAAFGPASEAVRAHG